MTLSDLVPQDALDLAVVLAFILLKRQQTTLHAAFLLAPLCLVIVIVLEQVLVMKLCYG